MKVAFTVEVSKHEGMQKKQKHTFKPAVLPDVNGLLATATDEQDRRSEVAGNI